MVYLYDKENVRLKSDTQRIWSNAEQGSMLCETRTVVVTGSNRDRSTVEVTTNKLY